jgi:glutaminyl-tRNA synthetase
MNAEEELKRIGIDEFNRNNYLKNKTLTDNILQVIKESGIKDNETVPSSVGALLVLVASNLPSQKHRALIAQYIAQRKLKNTQQVDAAIKFAKKSGASLDIAKFEEECGVGVEISPEDIRNQVADFINKNKAQLMKDRYLTKVGQLLGKLRAEKGLKWADGQLVKKELDDQLLALWGVKTEDDERREKEEKKKAKKDTKETSKNETVTVDKNSVIIKEEAPKRERKFEARELESAKNSERLLEEYRKATGGVVMTRFPPEPNGFLHIGHAKAMNLSFGYAQDMGGHTYLRYDDTNPEKEEKVYFDSIKEMVEWLGFKPFKITHTSDYFQQMYDFAIKLIKEGKAYVDLQSKEEIKRQRDARINSPYRDTPVEQNLKLFEDMRKGKFEEGKAVLRVKIDMQHNNPNMRDFIAYRIKYTPHPKTGDKWCIYPSYDYSHCIVDSLEWITHSLCTLEFEIRRDSYYWLLEALDIYRPHVYEFSRLNVTTALLSKRKILKLVKEGIIRGWDDPRVLTLAGLRRRGYTPEAIKSFCDDVGVTRTQNIIPIERLEESLRQDLDLRCDRVFCVLDPLKVVITNYPEDKVEIVKAPNHPTIKERGFRDMPFSRIIYIDRTDFREQDSKNYYGLALNKEVGLKYAYNITCTDIIKDKNGNIVELRATVDLEKKNKPKGHIHWIAQPAPGKEPLKCEVRLYEKLFTGEVEKAGDDWINMINKNSEIIMPNAYIESTFAQDPEKRKVYAKYQFERIGYFSVDQDTTENHLVFNRAVELKASKPVV